MILYIPINANVYLNITLKTHNLLVEISCFIYVCEAKKPPAASSDLPDGRFLQLIHSGHLTLNADFKHDVL